MRNEKAQIARLEESIRSLRKQINEVLASPYPFTLRPLRIHPDGEGEIYAEFEAFSNKYIYGITLTTGILPDKTAAVMGDVVFADESGEITVTGKGDAFRVMATVIEITKQIVNDSALMKRYIEATSPKGAAKPPFTIDILTFSAHEPSRRKLYERVARTVPGYTIVKKQEGYFTLLSDKIPAEKKELLKDLIGNLDLVV